MNFAQMANRFYWDLKYPDTKRLPIALLKEYLDEAERIINRKAKIVRGSSIVNSASDTQEYSLPTDILNWQIDDIYYSTGDSTERRRLIPTSIEQLNNIDREWRETNDAPVYWYIDRYNGVYGFAPFELSLNDGVNCIEVIYRKKHTKMTHYYVTGTVDVAKDSTAITGNSTAFIGNVSADDELGIGKLLDSAHVTDFPTTFFGISADAAADDALVLSSKYTGADGSVQNYIISSPSSILNDELNMCAVLLAMSMAKGKEGDRESQSSLFVQAMGRLDAEIASWLDDALMNQQLVPSGHAPYPGNADREDYRGGGNYGRGGW